MVSLHVISRNIQARPPLYPHFQWALLTSLQYLFYSSWRDQKKPTCSFKRLQKTAVWIHSLREAALQTSLSRPPYIRCPQVGMRVWASEAQHQANGLSCGTTWTRSDCLVPPLLLDKSRLPPLSFTHLHRDFVGTK